MSAILVALLWTVIYVIVICLIAYVLVWGVTKAAPEAAAPASRIIWALAVIACLIVFITVIVGAAGHGHGGLPYLTN